MIFRVEPWTYIALASKYENRKTLIDERLTAIGQTSSEVILKYIILIKYILL